MLERLIGKIARRLDEDKIPYMIIGGQAVNETAMVLKRFWAGQMTI